MSTLSRTPEVQQCLIDMEEVQSAIRGAVDLMSPETDLHCVNRNDVTVLFRYLTERQEELQEKLRIALTASASP